MKCPQCGKENAVEYASCVACGAGLIAGDGALGRRKRAFYGNTGIAGSPYITQPSVDVNRVIQVEKQMSMLLGVLFMATLALGALAVYLNLPDEEQQSYRVSPLAALIERALNSPLQHTHTQTFTGREIGAPMLYNANASTALQKIENALEEAPPAANKLQAGGEGKKRKSKEKVLQPKMEKPIQEAKAEPPPLHTLQPVASVEVPAAPPAENASMPPEKTEDPNANKVAVVDRSIVSDKPPKRHKSGCVLDKDTEECASRYVVTFKRKWGPIVEERAYPNPEMSQRAQELWRREGKILEPNGKINDSYVVKPKTFSPIPGHPA
jgi:hypothetical protein